MQDLTQKFLEIKAELENAKPITVNLSVAEIFSIISILQLAKVTMPGLNSYLETLWKKLNENDILKKLRNSEHITITIPAVEGFCLVTVAKIIKADYLGNSITIILVEEAGGKIMNALAKSI